MPVFSDNRFPLELQAPDNGAHEEDPRIKKILCRTEEGIPCEWIDNVGGKHDCGVGVAPDGTYCGECNEISCESCKLWREVIPMSEKEFVETYCHNCGSQRCEGPGTEWFSGCKNRFALRSHSVDGLLCGAEGCENFFNTRLH